MFCFFVISNTAAFGSLVGNEINTVVDTPFHVGFGVYGPDIDKESEVVAFL